MAGLTLTACAGDDGGTEGDTDSTTGTTSASTTSASTTSASTTSASTTMAETTGTTDTSTTGTTADTTSTTADTTGTTADTTGTTADTTGTTGDTTTGGVGPSFEADVFPLLMNRCGCHVGSPQAGLQFADAASAYSMLVNVKATQLGSMNRITPGDTDNSYLWRKVNATHLDAGGSGNMMPPGGKLMPMGLMLIEDWIINGANP
ncbi:MAG TPA: hypothetical protein PKW35_10505 [Nannocystaceae bacterium]|nr:hypothetical protein [Nannocystaceae bacterium]